MVDNLNERARDGLGTKRRDRLGVAYAPYRLGCLLNYRQPDSQIPPDPQVLPVPDTAHESDWSPTL